MNVSTNPIALKSGEVLNLNWGQITWLVSRSLQNSTVQTFGRVTIKGNTGNPVHRHPNCDELLHVLRGRIEHSLGSEKFLMNEGDTISIPAGVWHNARNLEKTDAEMIICFSSADRETETSDGEA